MRTFHFTVGEFAGKLIQEIATEKLLEYNFEGL
jgi:hypothetical protein